MSDDVILTGGFDQSQLFGRLPRSVAERLMRKELVVSFATMNTVLMEVSIVPAMPAKPTKPMSDTWWLATCVDCGGMLIQPFRDTRDNDTDQIVSGQAQRAEWCDAHQAATGHKILLSSEEPSPKKTVLGKMAEEQGRTNGQRGESAQS